MMTTQLMRRQVEAYREAWQEDYQASQECYDCEDFIRLGLFISAELKRINVQWRERVFRGKQVFSRETGTLLRSLFSTWLEVSSNLLRHNVARLEPHYRVEGADELKAAQTEVIDILHGWKAPKLSMAVGLRSQQVGNACWSELQSASANTMSIAPCEPSGVAEISAEDFLKSRRRRQKV